jgi:hypothetical protein
LFQKKVRKLEMVNHTKLKTNLKVAIQRLKLLEKKKSENARKSTKEIADFIQISKFIFFSKLEKTFFNQTN